jgi:hypothetical protein
VTAFVLAFGTIAILGHALLLRAALLPNRAARSQARGSYIGRNSPVRGSRRSVGSD